MKETKHIVSWKLVSFEDAHIFDSGEEFYSSLVVEGVSPYVNLELDLIPLVYSEQPEYWEIELVGCLRKFALPGLMPFQKILPLDFQIGSKGIELIGANGQRKKFECYFKEKANPDDGGRKMILVDRVAMIEKLKKDSETDNDKS